MDNKQMPSGAYTGNNKVVKWVIIYLVIGAVLYGGLYLAKLQSGYTAPVTSAGGTSAGAAPGINTPSAPSANTPQASAPTPVLPPSVAANAKGKISIQGFRFTPAVITVALGDTVVWTNKDSVAHTVTADGGQFNSGNLAPGKSFAMPPLNPGTYTYHCKIHPSMKGTVIVR